MKLGVFKAVGTTYSVGLRHFPAFYLLCLLAGLPSVIYAVFSGQSDIGQYLAMQGWQVWEKAVFHGAFDRRTERYLEPAGFTPIREESFVGDMVRLFVAQRME